MLLLSLIPIILCVALRTKRVLSRAAWISSATSLALAAACVAIMAVGPEVPAAGAPLGEDATFLQRQSATWATQHAIDAYNNKVIFGRIGCFLCVAVSLFLTLASPARIRRISTRLSAPEPIRRK